MMIKLGKSRTFAFGIQNMIKNNLNKHTRKETGFEANTNIIPSETPIIDKLEAIKEAQKLYNKVGSTYDAMMLENVSTDLNKIIKELEIKVRIIDLKAFYEENKEVFVEKDISGILVNDDGECTIYVNDSDSKESKRFTVAHEIGHYLLGHLKGGINVAYQNDLNFAFKRKNSLSPRSTSKEEIAANSFATELLMPELIVKYVYILFGSVEKVALAFGVSEEMAYYRLRNLKAI